MNIVMLPFPESDTPTMREEAQQWMASHPIAMGHFRRFARQMLEHRKRFGFKALAERVRWECAFESKGEEEFRINNNWTAYVARALLDEMPQLEGLIELRKTPAAEKPVRDSL